METITRISERRSIATDVTAAPRETPSTLAATATYLLSEDGRKASLLQGGDGRAVQTVTMQVPTNRLHLVSVDREGVARLRLRPFFQVNGDQRIVRVDAEPTFDAPPTIDELYQLAARNHELEHAHHAAKVSEAAQRHDAQHDVRLRAAEAFLLDKTARALPHPPPTPRVCHLMTPKGRLRFDIDRESGAAKEVPLEAYRRFRSDERATKERRQAERAANLALHEVKKQFLAAWIAEYGSAEQKARQATGMLPLVEAVAALTDHVFSALAAYPRYAHDGAERLMRVLPRELREKIGAITPADLQVDSEHAQMATAEQFALVQRIQAEVPDATVVLRRHRISLRRGEITTPSVPVFGILVTQKVGPLVIRREFAVPEA
ncbi:MAG: hypothetical protein AB7N65_17610 [Vicinamibacterales bacterium]